MSNYTKGEWQVIDGNFVYALNSNNTNRFDLSIHAGYTEIGKTPKDEIEANAHLISAAPDMYEALKGILLARNSALARAKGRKALAKAERW